jgi:hypothetical protein
MTFAASTGGQLSLSHEATLTVPFCAVPTILESYTCGKLRSNYNGIISLQKKGEGGGVHTSTIALTYARILLQPSQNVHLCW